MHWQQIQIYHVQVQVQVLVEVVVVVVQLLPTSNGTTDRGRKSDSTLAATFLMKYWITIAGAVTSIHSPEKSPQYTPRRRHLNRYNTSMPKLLLQEKKVPSPGRNAHQEIMVADEEGWRNVHQELGGSELVAIGEKTVTKSNRDTHPSRLLLTNDLRAKVDKQVSRDKEVDKINSDGGLEVKVINPAGCEYNMKCRYRECHKGMVINGGWNKFLRKP